MCTYYHKFRFKFRDIEYNYQDAVLVLLFVAYKMEDIIKKSKEILCTVYNFKTPFHGFPSKNEFCGTRKVRRNPLAPPEAMTRCRRV